MIAYLTPISVGVQTVPYLRVTDTPACSRYYIAGLSVMICPSFLPPPNGGAKAA
jgi:hypothetical protein